ncbi:MAG TPA: wax ester/triacylglycerol synthase family O-acyltransferase [Myxococcota bacterium]|nr:wax ester/triacylglycerol synthase family O-acyltransferase [Myxococcota bacterium]
MEPGGYDRLSAEDNAFLLAEGPTTPMHVSAVEIFEAGPLRREDGGIDADAIRDAYAAVLHRVPRYRQKLAWIPFARRAVWVDDPHFHLDYHVRHISLPRPGGMAELKRVASRVMEHHLDRSRPLWECWIIEGLEHDRFALLVKTHHCMIDGASGVELAQILLSPDPGQRAEAPRRYVPRRRPTQLALLRDEVLRAASLPLQAARGVQALRRTTSDLRGELTARLSALRELAGVAARGSSETPLNGRLCPHRRFDWLTLSLADTRAIRKALDCTVNDVVLATVTGALRTFLRGRQVPPEKLRFRVSAPVSMRSEAERGVPGNRVSSWMVELPIRQADPRKQLATIHAETQRLKTSQNALGIELLMNAAEWAPAGIVSLGARMASGSFNSIVTNVPGPQFPLYMLGARLRAMIPQVPLLENLGLCIALLSYDGQMHWGFTADYELVPDLPLFVAAVEASFEELARIAGVERAGAERECARGAESLVH